MQRIDDSVVVPGWRVRELARIYYVADRHAEKVLVRQVRESGVCGDARPERRRAEEMAQGALADLLDEGVPEGCWVRYSHFRQVLIEKGDFGLLRLRRAMRPAVRRAPEWTGADEVERKAFAIVCSWFSTPLKWLYRVAGFVGFWLLVAGGVALAVSALGGPEPGPWAAVVLACAVFSLMIGGILYLIAPRPLEEVLSRASAGTDDPPHAGEVVSDAGAGEREAVGATSVRTPALATSEGSSDDQSGGGVALTAYGHEDLGSSVQELIGARAVYENLEFPYVSYAGSATGEAESAASAGGGPRSVQGRSGCGEVEPDERQHLADEDRRDRLNNIRIEDLGEDFTFADARPENHARGSDAIRVVEATGELAAVMGIEQGEAVMEIAWRTEPRARHSRSFVPYREVVAGTSLDPASPLPERIRPGSRQQLYEVIAAEKAAVCARPKITYRIAPDGDRFFGVPSRSEGMGPGYELEDKLEYFYNRAIELGFDRYFKSEERRRMEEILMGEGYAPENEELLNLAMVAGIDPRYFFEDSGEDLRYLGRRSHARKHGGAPSGVVLWRIEAAVSEAHGIPVEIFECRLIEWYVSRDAWSFR